MRSLTRLRTSIAPALLLAAIVLYAPSHARADTASFSISGNINSSTIDGVPVGAGRYTLNDLSTAGAALGLVNGSGETGVSLWSLLGGTASGTSDVVTSTPAGDNGKNAILHSYLLATSVTGAQSVISLGEIDPFFGGNGATPDFVSFSAADGKPQLVFPSAGASGRNVIDLAALQVLTAPALAAAAGGASDRVVVSGPVAGSGTYTLSRLQALPAVNGAVSGDIYTGVPLWNLIGAQSNVATSYVLASGTDGYEVLYSLAELDPANGAPQDLVPYADTQGQFPSDGIARTVIPGDNHQGRWVSNLDSLQVVTAVPEPSTALYVFAAFCALYISKYRRDRRTQSRYSTIDRRSRQSSAKKRRASMVSAGTPVYVSNRHRKYGERQGMLR